MRLSFDMPSLHIPFFHALSRCPPDSVDWRATTAGLLTVRLVDRRLSTRPPTWRETRRVRRAIQAVDRASPLYPGLTALFAAVSSMWRPRRHRIVEALHAYAESLFSIDEMDLAADVYETVIAYSAQLPIAAEAYEHAGEALRSLGRYDEAAQRFREGRALALTRGDVVGELRMRIAEASVASRRGRIGEAHAILAETIGAAERAGLLHVRALALGAM
jgi:tetratricopeptide (TPR) repeat protein